MVDSVADSVVDSVAIMVTEDMGIEDMGIKGTVDMEDVTDVEEDTEDTAAVPLPTAEPMPVL